MIPGRGAASGACLGAAGNRPPLRLRNGQRAGRYVRFTELGYRDLEFSLSNSRPESGPSGVSDPHYWCPNPKPLPRRLVRRQFPVVAEDDGGGIAGFEGDLVGAFHDGDAVGNE